MTRKEKITDFINGLREYDIYDLETLDLIESICKSAYENGTEENDYLEKLIGVMKNEQQK